MLLLMMMLCRRKLKTGDAAAGVDIDVLQMTPRKKAKDAVEDAEGGWWWWCCSCS